MNTDNDATKESSREHACTSFFPPEKHQSQLFFSLFFFFFSFLKPDRTCGYVMPFPCSYIPDLEHTALVLPCSSFSVFLPPLSCLYLLVQLASSPHHLHIHAFRNTVLLLLDILVFCFQSFHLEVIQAFSLWRTLSATRKEQQMGNISKQWVRHTAWWTVRPLIWSSETNKRNTNKNTQTKLKQSKTLLREGSVSVIGRKCGAVALHTALGLKQDLHRFLKSASAWDTH